MPQLVRPDPCYRVSFLAAMAEFADEGRSGDDSQVGSDLATYADTWHTEAGFVTYVEDVTAESHTPRREGYVTSTNLWWVDGVDYLGRISVRHRLTDFLLEVGGHIGYDVRRSRRREGHATAMLAAALPVVADLGIDPALITCDVTNTASRLVIEHNGGVFEDQRGKKLRYWVPTR